MLCCKFYSLVCTTSISKSRTSHSSLFFNPSLPLSLFLSLFLSLHFYQSTSRLTFFLLLSSFSPYLPSLILFSLSLVLPSSFSHLFHLIFLLIFLNFFFTFFPLILSFYFLFIYFFYQWPVQQPSKIWRECQFSALIRQEH